MAKQVAWTSDLVDKFIEKAMLSDEEAYIMRSRCKGVPVSQQSIYLNRSESSVHKMINRLKKKYDAVQKENPDIFPERKSSAKETYMDTH